jgi:osmotically inducible protein OsmC
MPTRYANATWEGGLKNGKGNLELESGLFKGPYDYLSRFETGPTTNPEELLGASHAGCYAMFLGALLEGNETPATKLEVKSSVTVQPTDDGPTITKIVLSLVGEVPNISEEKFLELAQQAKEKCPISKSLAAVAEMDLEAKLKS